MTQTTTVIIQILVVLAFFSYNYRLCHLQPLRFFSSLFLSPSFLRCTGGMYQKIMFLFQHVHEVLF